MCHMGGKLNRMVNIKHIHRFIWDIGDHSRVSKGKKQGYQGIIHKGWAIENKILGEVV